MKDELKSRLMSIVTMIAVMMLFALTLFSASALVPLGVDTLTAGPSSKQDESLYAAKTHDAYAGNITELNFSAVAQTKHWQGYFGEITGTIVLDDANNWTLYNWALTEPKGEIYATVNTTTPDWDNVTCLNFSNGSIRNLGNGSQWEAYYNMTYNDVDGIDETFNQRRHEAFDIGDVVTIYNSTCMSTYTFQVDAAQSTRYSEVLLSDSEGRMIFTTLIENKDNANNTDVKGFDNRTHDFQMLVAEDGTGRVGGAGGPINTAITTYYFYVDIQ
jgi:hypothetical protein